MRRVRWLLGLLALGLALVPIVCMGIEMLATHQFGRTVKEAGAHPCDVWGLDVSEPLCTIGTYAAWGALIFWPWAVGVLLLWGVIELVRALTRANR